MMLTGIILAVWGVAFRLVMAIKPETKDESVLRSHPMPGTKEYQQKVRTGMVIFRREHPGRVEGICYGAIVLGLMLIGLSLLL